MRRILLLLLVLGVLQTPAQAQECQWDQAPGWVARENLKKGDVKWDLEVPLRFSGDYSRRKTIPRVEGYFSTASAGCGETAKLTVLGAKNFTAKIYRMGYYKGTHARLITSLNSPKYITVNSNLVPGQYLIKLLSKNKMSTFVPLVIKGKTTTDLTFISAVLTWQSYNQWGGQSLYKGSDGKRETAATSVSFNRPYDGDGSGQFRYMEQGITSLAEKLGIDLNYLTDLDVDRDPKILSETKSIMFGGHNEYWSQKMRQSYDDAVLRGVNLLVFGGNTGYALSTITDRNLSGRTPYRELNNPESLLLGSQYFALGVKKDLVASDTWPFSILGTDAVIKSIYGYEADTAMGTRGPGVQILARAVISPTEKGFVAMSTYYRAPSGAAVLNLGTNGWVCAINNRCPWGHSFDGATQKQLQEVSLEILKKVGGSNWPVAQIDIPARP